MSIEAVSWALNTKRVATPMQRLVLIAVANHADKRGQSAWPSQETLAEYCCCSSRTIRRQLSELEESGIIRRGDQRLVSHFRGGYRPVVMTSIWAAMSLRITLVEAGHLQQI